MVDLLDLPVGYNQGILLDFFLLFQTSYILCNINFSTGLGSIFFALNTKDVKLNRPFENVSLLFDLFNVSPLYSLSYCSEFGAGAKNVKDQLFSKQLIALTYTPIIKISSKYKPI